MSRVTKRSSVLTFILLCLWSTLALAAPEIEFDHSKTGFDLTGMHRGVNCESCHQAGVFQGTPKQCMSCHLQGKIAGSSISTDHISTNNDCQSCHTTVQWSPVQVVDHSAVIGTCASCHNAASAEGAPSTHPSTTADCATCHRTSTWT